MIMSSYSFVMSVTVPLLIRLPLESDTLTTALTTADLSLFSKLSSSSVSILAWATGGDDNVFLLLTTTFLVFVFVLPRARLGAWISSSLARGSFEGGTAPVKMLLTPVSLFFVALYCGGAEYRGLGGPTGW